MTWYILSARNVSPGHRHDLSTVCRCDTDLRFDGESSRIPWRCRWMNPVISVYMTEKIRISCHSWTCEEKPMQFKDWPVPAWHLSINADPTKMYSRKRRSGILRCSCQLNPDPCDNKILIKTVSRWLRLRLLRSTLRYP